MDILQILNKRLAIKETRSEYINSIMKKFNKYKKHHQEDFDEEDDKNKNRLI